MSEWDQTTFKTFRSLKSDDGRFPGGRKPSWKPKGALNYAAVSVSLPVFNGSDKVPFPGEWFCRMKREDWLKVERTGTQNSYFCLVTWWCDTHKWQMMMDLQLNLPQFPFFGWKCVRGSKYVMLNDFWKIYCHVRWEVSTHTAHRTHDVQCNVCRVPSSALCLDPE